MKFVWTLVGTLTVAVVTSDPVYIQPVCTIPSPDADTVSIQCSTTSKIFQFFLNAKSAGAFLSNVSAWEKRHGNVSINNNRVDFNVVLLSSFRDGKKSRMYVLLTFSHSAGQLDINATCRSENNQSHINSNTLDKCHRTLIANNGTLAIHYVKTVEMNDSFLYIYTVSHQQQLDYVLLSGPQKEAHFQTSANQSLLVVLSRDKEFNISLGTGENSLTNVSSVPLSTTTATEISSMSGESGNGSGKIKVILLSTLLPVIAIALVICLISVVICILPTEVRKSLMGRIYNKVRRNYEPGIRPTR